MGLFCIQRLFAGDYARVLDLARTAEAKGIDQVSIPDHVAISGDGVQKYHNRFPMGVEEPWYEPVSVLSAIAGVTSRLRLSTSIFIAPLRPAVLLAKQLATLDVLSRGRVEIGLGVGWQEEEYEASGLSFADRFAYLDEQVRAMRLLWRDAPASFEGRHVRFSNLYSLPFPVKRSIPVWLGLAPTPIGSRRIAELGDGWLPNMFDPVQIAAGVKTIREAFLAKGRDPDTLEVRAGLGPVRREDGTVDLDASFAAAPRLVEAGVTMIEVSPFFFCREAGQIDELLERAAALKNLS
jgi:probable F420-dependent oxidoreductase